MSTEADQTLRPHVDDRTALLEYAYPKNGKLTQSQLMRLLNCTAPHVAGLILAMEKWSQTCEEAKNITPLGARAAHPKEWGKNKTAIVLWLQADTFWGSDNRFGALQMTTTTPTLEQRALWNAVSYVTSKALRSRRPGIAGDTAPLSEFHGITRGIDKAAPPDVLSQHGPEKVTGQILTCLGRRSVIIMDGMDLDPIGRFPFSSAAEHVQDRSATREMWAEDIMWDRFAKLVYRATEAELRCSKISMGTKMGVTDLIDADSLEVALVRYMEGNYQDMMGNFCVYIQAMSHSLED